MISHQQSQIYLILQDYLWPLNLLEKNYKIGQTRIGVMDDAGMQQLLTKIRESVVMLTKLNKDEDS